MVSHLSPQSSPLAERPITTFEQHINRAHAGVQVMVDALQGFKATTQLEANANKLEKAYAISLANAKAAVDTVKTGAAAAAERIAALKAKYGK